MKSTGLRVLALAIGLSFLLAVLTRGGADAPRTGPETEKRFPPLKVPPGFKATLFACNPLIEYPSVIAVGPRPRTLFVAIDYVTGLGVEIVRRDEIRLAEDTDGDGYADKAPVYAKEFNSIQGLAYHQGTVFVMHAPFLTALRDTNGDGVADDRKDLLTGLGLVPEKNPSRLHCANGVTVGHDGWLYLSLGDNGCDIPRPEGDRLVLQAGGILRCRPDGRALHVFATGLRNIYDVALDEDLNVFVRDNENDGGTYMIRVYHSFFGADHGYPYHYYERPDEALRPLADLALGSSAGGVCYLETRFPAEYQGNLFFCEWGRAVMRYRPERMGSSFAPLKELEFAAGADNDPYGFKPTDLVVDRDGSLLVSDWADGQRPKRGRGRIYRIAPLEGPKPSPRPDVHKASLAELIALLDSTSHYHRMDAQAAIEQRGAEGVKAVREAIRQKRLGVRGRLHAVWVLAHGNGAAAVSELLDLARTDADPRVQAQAVRAAADLTDPVLTKHRLDAAPGNTEQAKELAALAEGRDVRVLREVVVAVGRLGWPDAPDWLRKSVQKPDAALAHAAMQTLRRVNNWPAVLKLLDEPDSEPIRAIALRAIGEQYHSIIADSLMDRLRKEASPSHRREYADALTRIHKKPGPYVYWGYRPAPRPVNTVAWERTEAIEQALDAALADPDRSVRLAVLQRMQREKVPVRPATLAAWLNADRESERVALLLQAVRDQPAATVRDLLAGVVANREHAKENRLAALGQFINGLDEANADRLLKVAETLEDGPVLADAIRQLSRRPKLKAGTFLLAKLDSPDAEVRAASVDALGVLGVAEATGPGRKLLQDKEAQVRQAAAAAMGRLGVREAIEPLLVLARDPQPPVRSAALDALRLLREPRVVPLAAGALAERETQAAALRCITDLGGPDQLKPVVELARRDTSVEVLPPVIRLLTQWSKRPGLPAAERLALDQTVADLQGASGTLVRWQAIGPLPAKDATAVLDWLIAAGNLPDPMPGNSLTWTGLFAMGAESRIQLGTSKQDAVTWLAWTDLRVPEAGPVQFLGSSSGRLWVWLNGKLAYQRKEARGLQPDADRFDATLAKESNRVVVEVASPPQAAELQLRFRKKSSTAEHERLLQQALTRAGNTERGRKVFENAEKSQCLKCHRLGNQGERIGPDLTGVGNRFSRIYLIESLLEPSRTIAPSYETLLVVLANGRVFNGVRVAETETTLTLADNQGLKHELKKADIDERKRQPLSTMPDGLEKRLTADEFIDLIAFLVSQKQ